MAKLKDRYANALLELSQERASLEDDLQEADLVRHTLGQADVQAFLMHPKVSDSDKVKLFSKAFSDKISKDLMGFLVLTVRKNREKLILPVLEEYIELINREFNRIEAKVVSAKALTEKQIQSIHRVLSKQINKEIHIETKIDPNVIGGFYVLVDGRIFDGTLRSKMNIMREHLKRGSFE